MELNTGLTNLNDVLGKVQETIGKSRDIQQGDPQELKVTPVSDDGGVAGAGVSEPAQQEAQVPAAGTPQQPAAAPETPAPKAASARVPATPATPATPAPSADDAANMGAGDYSGYDDYSAEMWPEYEYPDNANGLNPKVENYYDVVGMSGGSSPTRRRVRKSNAGARSDNSIDGEFDVDSLYDYVEDYTDIFPRRWKTSYGSFWRRWGSKKANKGNVPEDVLEGTSNEQVRTAYDRLKSWGATDEQIIEIANDYINSDKGKYDEKKRDGGWIDATVKLSERLINYVNMRNKARSGNEQDDSYQDDSDEYQYQQRREEARDEKQSSYSQDMEGYTVVDFTDAAEARKAQAEEIISSFERVFDAKGRSRLTRSQQIRIANDITSSMMNAGFSKEEIVEAADSVRRRMEADGSSSKYARVLQTVSNLPEDSGDVGRNRSDNEDYSFQWANNPEYSFLDSVSGMKRTLDNQQEWINAYNDPKYVALAQDLQKAINVKNAVKEKEELSINDIDEANRLVNKKWKPLLEYLEDHGLYDRRMPMTEVEKLEVEESDLPSSKKLNEKFQAIQTNKELYHNGYIGCTEEKWSPDHGCMEIADEDAEMAFRKLSMMLGYDRFTESEYVWRTIMLATSFGSDSKSQIWGLPAGDVRLDPNQIIEAANICAASIMKYGHPFGITSMNFGVVWGGSVRFPIGVVPDDLAKSLVDHGSLGFATAKDLQNSVKDLWMRPETGTYAIISSSLQGSDANLKQLACIEQMVMALADIDGKESMEFGIPGPHEQSLAEFNREKLEAAGFIDSSDAYVAARNDINERTERLKERARSHGQEILNGKGETTGYNIDTSYWFAQDILSTARFVRVFGDPILMGSAKIEKVFNNYTTRVSEWILRHALSKKDGAAVKAYTFDKDAEKDFCTNADVNDCFKNIIKMFDIGGWDLVQVFAAEKIPPTNANVDAFCKKMLGSSDNKMHMAASKMKQALDTLIPGDFGSVSGDVKLWLNAFMNIQMMNNGADASDCEKFMQVDPTRFMVEAFATEAGKDALISIRSGYAGRISPTSEAAKGVLREHPYVDMFISTVLGGYYPNYAVKAFELWVPFSNTMSLLAVKSGKTGLNAETQIGFSMDDQAALNRALVYDVVRMGSRGLMAMALWGFIKAFGGIIPPDPPDDDDDENAVFDENGNRVNDKDVNDKWLLPWEWKIKLPWNNEALPMKQLWALDDLMMNSAVIAVALQYKDQQAEAGADQSEIIADMLSMITNGSLDIFGSNKLFEIFGFVGNMAVSIPQFCKYVSGAAEELPDGNEFKELGELLEGKEADAKVLGFLADRISKLTPTAVNYIYKLTWSDEIKRDPRKVIITDEDGNRKSVYRNNNSTEFDAEYTGDSGEVAWNRVAQYDLGTTILGNLVYWLGSGKWGEEKFGRAATGYQTHGDKDDEAEMNSQFEHYVESDEYKEWLAQPENKAIADIDSDLAKKYAYASHLFDDLSQYDSLEDAAESGMMMSRSDANMVRKMLWASASDILDTISEWKQSYYNYEISTYDDLQRNVQPLYDKYYSITKIANGLSTSGLVYDPDRYVELEGTTVRNPTTGEYYNYGDDGLTSWFLPMYSPKGKTEGSATMPGWRDTEIGRDFQTNAYYEDSDSSDTMLTSGGRNWVVNKESDLYDKEIEDLKAAVEEKLADVKSTSDSRSGSNSSSYSSYSNSRSYSSGSSSRPKVYSNGRTFNMSKPSTMYGKTPYSTTQQYLSPTVYTEGSRDPYSRRDG